MPVASTLLAEYLGGKIQLAQKIQIYGIVLQRFERTGTSDKGLLKRKKKRTALYPPH